MIGLDRIVRVVLAAVVAVVLIAPVAAQGVGGEGEGWPSFNESDGCGSPWAIGPNAETTGSLPDSTILRGPQAGYFGRTIDQVRQSLVPWHVPMSDGEVLFVHRRLLSALSGVAAKLESADRIGRFYDVIGAETFAFVPRTVGGKFRVSQHAFGNAIDINSLSNPARQHELITDMPRWFVDAWSSAGFCWGGRWVDIKDPMHFNWRGPAFTEGIVRLPRQYPPLTSPEDFSRQIFSQEVPNTSSRARFEILMDVDGDGAIDVATISDLGAASVIEVATARSGYRPCGTMRYRSLPPITGSAVFPGDWDRDGMQDLWAVDDTDGLRVTARLRTSDFRVAETVEIAAAPGDRYMAADHNLDGWSDLYILRETASGWDVEVRSGEDRFATVLAAGSIEASSSALFTAIDRNLDQVPDVVAIDSSRTVIVDGASDFGRVEQVRSVFGAYSDVAGTDFDGDGRHDIAVLGDSTVSVFAGNSPLDGVEVTSWFLSSDETCGPSRFGIPVE